MDHACRGVKPVAMSGLNYKPRWCLFDARCREIMRLPVGSRVSGSFVATNKYGTVTSCLSLAHNYRHQVTGVQA